MYNCGKPWAGCGGTAPKKIHVLVVFGGKAAKNHKKKSQIRAGGENQCD